MRKHGLVTLFVVFGVLIGSLLALTTYTSAQAVGDVAPPLQTTHHNTMSNNDTVIPVTGTMPMGDMSQMMPMMMQMMGHHMHVMGHMQNMMNGTMPMTDTMHMSGTMPMGDMFQMMPMMMQMMGRHMQMMGGTMPMSGTMPMGDMSQMMPMMMQMMGTQPGMMAGSTPMSDTISMGYRMQMMGLHMQMMGLHMQMASRMHDMMNDSMPMMDMVHPQQQGMTRDEMTERQAEVAEAGRAVMPFDLDATTHIFEKNEQGGLQQIIADDPSDTNTIEQIRSHLAGEAERFAQGDFRSPQMIHGAAMPGLHELMMGADQIAIEYGDLPNGAQILYTTDDADLIDALHRWFDAQVADHGQHAVDQR